MTQADLARHWRQAEAFAQQGQLHAALKAYEQVIALDAGHAQARLRASRVALALGRYRQAHAHVMAAASRAPTSEEGVVTLARALRQFNEPRALVDLFADEAWLRWRSAERLTEMATLVSSVGENALARRMVEVALQRDPRHPPAHYFAGVVHMFFGDMALAESALERCVTLAPTFAQAHWVLSRLRTWSAAENHADRLRALLARAKPAGIDEPYLAFALHNELHDAKDFAGAWDALERGCRSKRRSTPHERADARAMYERLRATCDARFVADHPPTSDLPYRPVFIVGMHRSGSTLLEQLVAGHDDVTDGGETYAFTSQMRLAADYRSKGVLDGELARRASGVDYGFVRERFMQATAWRAQGRRVLTEKLPSNFLNVGFIARAFPEARFLHMVRDPRDTCFSNLRTLFSDVNTFSYDQRELAEWFGQYRALMAHWHAVMPGRILDVDYAALVADPHAVMRGVFDHCGLAWQDTVGTLGQSGSVATASSPQMRGGIIRNRSPAWAPYEAQLAPMFEALAARAD